MKKVNAIIAIIIGLITVLCTGCKKVKGPEDGVEPDVYALELITSKYHLNPTRTKDELSTNVESWVATTNNGDSCCLWIVDKNADEEIFFLYDKSSVIKAEEAPVTVDKEMKISDYQDYKTTNNSLPGTFAWKTDKLSYAVLTKDPYDCNSIWAFDKSSNQISLVYYNSENENWKEYNS